MKVDVTATEIRVTIPFARKDEIAEIKGGRWDRGKKQWCFPSTPHAAQSLIGAFPELQTSVEVLELSIENLDATPDQPDHFTTKLWEHQRRAVSTCWHRPASMLSMEMRTGKTAVSLALATLWNCQRILVTCPLSVCGVWQAELVRHTSCEWTVARLDATSVKRKAEILFTASNYAQKEKLPFICIVNHESLWREPFGSAAIGMKWDLAIVDECFPAGTKILTPKGERSIEDIREFDEIIGVDHSTGKPVTAEVVHCFKNNHSKPLLRVCGVTMTREHPVWTSNGYLPAKDVQDLDSVCHIELNSHNGDLQIDMRMVRQDEYENSEQESKDQGRKERPPSGRSRMDCSSIQEQANPERSKQSGVHHHGSRQVYNLETTTGNYVAGGLLVHNCHRAKAPGGKFSRYLSRLADQVPRRLALTGTPLPHSPLDAYAQYRFLDRSIFGSSFNRFKNRYAVQGGFQGHEIVDWQRMDEFSKNFHEIAFECSTEEAFDLPDEMDIRRSAKLEKSAQKVYASMAAHFWAEVEKGEVTAANALVKLLRLQQCTSGWMKNDAGEMIRVSTAKQKLLEDILEDFPTSTPLVIFVRFTKDIDAVREVCEKQGRLVGEVSGQRKDLADDGTFPEGYDVMVCQIQSGSLGVNLSRASTAFFYSWGWNLGDVEQARARIRHPDQVEKLQFIHLVIEQSIDERMMVCLKNRRDFIEDVLEQGRNTNGSEEDSPQEESPFAKEG